MRGLFKRKHACESTLQIASVYFWLESDAVRTRIMDLMGPDFDTKKLKFTITGLLSAFIARLGQMRDIDIPAAVEMASRPLRNEIMKQRRENDLVKRDLNTFTNRVRRDGEEIVAFIKAQFPPEKYEPLLELRGLPPGTVLAILCGMKDKGWEVFRGTAKVDQPPLDHPV